MSEYKKIVPILLAMIPLLGLLAISGLVYIQREALATRESAREPLPIYLRALNGFDTARAKLVSREELALNPVRVAAGLQPLGDDWLVSPAGGVSHGPTMEVAIDASGLPTRVILRTDWGGFAAMCRRKEFEVTDGYVEGKAACWTGDPLRLLLTEEYVRNRLEGIRKIYSQSGEIEAECEYLNDSPWSGVDISFVPVGPDYYPFERTTYARGLREGMSTYFAEDGSIVARCSFRGGWPWDGHYIERRQFGGERKEADYTNGKLDGEVREFTWNDELTVLETYESDIPHGVFRSYYDNALPQKETTYDHGNVIESKEWRHTGALIRSLKTTPDHIETKEWSDEGVPVSETRERDGHVFYRKSWYPNGQRKAEAHYDEDGRFHGPSVRWHLKGHIMKSASYHHGELHGHRLTQKIWPDGAWYWKGKLLRGGEPEFDDLVAEENSQPK